MKNIIYKDIPGDFFLPYQFLKIAIFEETKYLFKSQPYIIEKWEKDAYQMTEEEIRNQVPPNSMSPSFKALYFFITEQIFFQQPFINKKMIIEAVSDFADTFIKLITPRYTIKEFPEVVKESLNDKIMEQTLTGDFLYTSMDNDYHMLRNIVAKQKDFKESEAEILAAELVDNKGNFRGMAELRPTQTSVEKLTADQEALWMKLVDSAYNALDELTADLFDLITYLWMVGDKTNDGFILFHSTDALEIRQLQNPKEDSKELIIRERDRFNIMKRVVALSSMWVSLSNGKIITNKDELYSYQDFKRMFDIGTIRVAYDKNTGEAKGIYALEIKPSSLLAPLISASSQMMGLLHLKVFQYSHHTQREHKRLLRYIDRQWKMRHWKKTSLTRPFKISTLLKEMDISSRYNGSDTKDKFENVLDDFKADGVIKDWSYKEEYEEKLVGRKGWFKQWSNNSVIIYPTDSLLAGYRELRSTKNSKETLQKIALKEVKQVEEEPYFIKSIVDEVASTVETELSKTFPEKSSNIPEKKDQVEMDNKPQAMNFEQQVLELNEEKENIFLTPEEMQKAINLIGLSLRKVADEIGIAHTTLSRYLKQENKRPNKKNDEKMVTWLRERFK